MTTDAALRREEVPAAFDTGAAAYDRLVGANPGYHAHLRLSARRMRLPGDGRGLHLLDAGSAPLDAAGVPPDAAGVPPDAASAPPVTGTG